MSMGHTGSKESERIDQEAVEWFVRRDAGMDAETQLAFEAWLAADPRHAERFAWHERSWARFEGLEEHELDPALAPAAPAIHRRPASFWRQAWVCGGLAVALAWLGWSGWRQSRALSAQEFRVGAYESHILQEGSIIELKGGTRLQVRLDSKERSVRLSEGEAHFHVAKDPQRPFVVYAAGTSVRAVGTAFNVRVTSQAIEVLVTEGTVRLTPDATDAASASAREMNANQRSIIPRTTPLTSAAPPVDSLSADGIGELLAWKPATLEFSGALLGDVVTAFNKRNRIQIAIGSEELRRMPIDLSFKSDDVDAFLRLLELTFDIRVERLESERIVLSSCR